MTFYSAWEALVRSVVWAPGLRPGAGLSRAARQALLCTAECNCGALTRLVCVLAVPEELHVSCTS